MLLLVDLELHRGEHACGLGRFRELRRQGLQLLKSSGQIRGVELLPRSCETEDKGAFGLFFLSARIQFGG